LRSGDRAAGGAPATAGLGFAGFLPALFGPDARDRPQPGVRQSSSPGVALSLSAIADSRRSTSVRYGETSTDAENPAEANVIVRREETAAMRSQANTAKLLEGNPTLMRLRELEVLEKRAASGS